MAILIRNWITGDPTLEEDIELMRNRAKTLLARGVAISTKVRNEELHDGNIRLMEGVEEEEVGRDRIQLPQNTKELHLLNCMFQVRSLVDVFALTDGSESLKRLTIVDCEGIQYLWADQSSCSKLKNLEDLTIIRSNFIGLTEGRISPGAFGNLKTLKVDGCDNVEKLFTPPRLLDGQLGNLKDIFIADCESLVEIFDLDGDANVELPKLRNLALHNLPRLVSICKPGLQLCCKSIFEIIVKDCKELRKLPLFGHLLGNDQLPSAPPLCLEYIKVEEQWWESLVWDDPRMKQTLQPFLRFY